MTSRTPEDQISSIVFEESNLNALTEIVVKHWLEDQELRWNAQFSSIGSYQCCESDEGYEADMDWDMMDADDVDIYFESNRQDPSVVQPTLDGLALYQALPQALQVMLVERAKPLARAKLAVLKSQRRYRQRRARHGLFVLGQNRRETRAKATVEDFRFAFASRIECRNTGRHGLVGAAVEEFDRYFKRIDPLLAVLNSGSRYPERVDPLIEKIWCGQVEVKSGLTFYSYDPELNFDQQPDCKAVAITGPLVQIEQRVEGETYLRLVAMSTLHQKLSVSFAQYMDKLGGAWPAERSVALVLDLTKD